MSQDGECSVYKVKKKDSVLEGSMGAPRRSTSDTKMHAYPRYSLGRGVMQLGPLCPTLSLFREQRGSARAKRSAQSVADARGQRRPACFKCVLEAFFKDFNVF